MKEQVKRSASWFPPGCLVSQTNKQQTLVLIMSCNGDDGLVSQTLNICESVQCSPQMLGVVVTISF